MFSKPELTSEPNIPIVVCANLGNYNYDSISCNTDSMFNDSIKYLKSLGHKNIGYVGETYTSYSLGSFRQAMANNGLQHNEDYIYKIKGRFEAVTVLVSASTVPAVPMPTLTIG